ncbi:TIM-barrel domain-containing protein [Actinotalea subterranea]|uniref:glycoside hydrolase family 31 protein n=1 Tax=Actinotalea subterranea TaxID=2607497 RepID=UPI0011ECDB5C|nr:TIM-barrel domain-containing protein [Actinotalea subterranea]
MTLRHRPAGIEHPYAASPDQRTPVLPLVGEPIHLGVEAHEVRDVCLTWEVTGADGIPRATTLPAHALATDTADAAALAGGEGHLAEAQAAQLASSGAYGVDVPGLADDERARYRFTGTATDGTPVETPWFEVAPASWRPEGGSLTVDGIPVDGHPRVVPGSVTWLASADGLHRVRFSLRIAPDAHVVGFGERYDAVDQRGRVLDAVVFEQYKSQGRFGRTYLPMPFAHVLPGPSGGEPWGFHVRTSRRSWYDVGATDQSELRVEVALGGTHDEALDVGLYTGAPHEVLDAFLTEVGRPEELPAWVLRLWASGNEWNTQALVTERMATHAELGIPVGAVVIEAWSDEEGIMIWRDAAYEPRPDGSPFRADDFTWGDAWPDPKAMVDALHARGIKVILWQIPLLKTRHDLPPQTPDDAQVLLEGTAMVEGGHCVTEADGTPYRNRGWWFPQSLMPDLSVQRTRDWWTAKRRYLVEDLGVDGFKTDGGEHAWGADLRYADGRRGDEGNNLYPVHYARAFGDLLRSAGKAPVTFSRSGFTGSQAHGLFWAGDEDSTWEAFRWTLNAGITAASCGIVYWGWDLGGFSGPVPDPELYVRSAAAATFMPVMQYHSEFNHHRPPLRDRTPWNVADLTGDTAVVGEFKRLAHLRERLVPYLAEQAAGTIASSRPLMRGLFFDWPDDAAVWDWPAEYLLGDDLLVHPVTEPGATTWRTYLPAGTWTDLWSGEVHDGGRVVERDVPRDVVPVYVRTSDDGATASALRADLGL